MDGIIALAFAKKLYGLQKGPKGDPGEVSEAELIAALESYAKIDGSYDNLTAGNAKQLVSTVRANDKVPYNFRTSGGSVDIGDREYINSIVGGTVAWNQMCTNGNFEYRSGNYGWYSSAGTVVVSDNIGKFTANAYKGNMAIATSIVSGHKYLAEAEVKTSSNLVSFNFWTAFKEATGSGSFEKMSVIANVVHDGTSISYPRVSDNRQSGWDEIQMKHVCVFDLTQMFGSTIADYLYTLETNHAGDGVAWFKKLFPKPYYAYDSGSIQSVKTSKHKTVGFNQWDEEWEVGTLDATTGEKVNADDRIRSKNFIPCLPNTTYSFTFPAYAHKVTGDLRFAFYDANKNHLGSRDNWGLTTTFTTPSNAYYFMFITNGSYGTTYGNDICINLSWDGSRDGEYEPYEAHEYALDSDLTLRGIPKLDANNSLYYDGDTYESDGTVTRKYGVVDLGTLDWTYDSESVRFFTINLQGVIRSVADNYYVGNIICFKYLTVALNTLWSSTTGVIAVSATGAVSIRDTSYTDAATFKTAMDGVYLVYELATPTTESADSYQSPQIVDDFGTEEYVDTRDVAIPVGHDTDYPINILAKVEMAPNSPDGDGDYIVRQTNGENAYVPLVIEDALPTMPSTAGEYRLIVTIADGEDPVLSWEANE